MDKYYEELRVQVHAEKMGEDLCVTICGGDRAHIGSVAIAEPRESMSGDGLMSSTVSTFNFTGHKDDTVANRVAHELATRMGTRVVVLCGLHYDSIDPSLILAIDALSNKISEDVAAISSADILAEK